MSRFQFQVQFIIYEEEMQVGVKTWIPSYIRATEFPKILTSLGPPQFQVLPTLWLKYFSNFTLASSTHWVQLRGLLLSILITWKQPSKLSPDFIL